MPPKTPPTAQVVKPKATVVAHWRDRFKHSLAKRFFLRLHMSLILMTTGLAGFIVNRLLLWGGVGDMAVRYGLSVVVGYGVFLLCIRLWLRYVSGGHFRSPGVTVGDGRLTADLVQAGMEGMRDLGRGSVSGGSLPTGTLSAPSGEAAAGSFFEGVSAVKPGEAAEGAFFEGAAAPASSGGEAAGFSFLDGAGSGGAVHEPGDAEIGTAAAAFFDQPAGAAELDMASGSAGADLSSGGSGGGLGGLDLDFDTDDAGAVIALIALAVIVLIVCGAGAYLIYEAPMILSDAAFQVVMTWAVRRKAGQLDDAAWVGSVVKATIWPFVIVFVLTVVTGLGVQAAYPDVTSLGELIRR